MARSVWLTILVLIGVLGTAIYGALEHYKFELYQAAMHARAEQARMSTHHIQVGEFNVAYLENDLRDKKPTLLMVHGFGASKENWLDLAIQLKDDFHMIAVDLPGHGETTQLKDKSYDLDAQVQRLHAFMAAIGIQHFSIIGNSMGGGITALYAGTYPDQIQSAILLDPAGITDVKSEYQRYLDEGRNPLIVRSPQDFDYLLSFVAARKPFIPWPLTEVSTEKMIRRSAMNAQIFKDITGAHEYDFKQAITRITAPTLVGWGDQDRVLAPGNAKIFQQLIPHSKIQLFTQVGHVPMLEVPAKCAQVVKDFIRQAGKIAAR